MRDYDDTKSSQARQHSGRQSVRLLPLLAFLITSTAASAADQTITRIGDALALSQRDLKAKTPAHFRAVVTSVDASYRMQFLQDDSGGIYLHNFTPKIELAAGDVVEAKGVIGQGLFAPTLDSATVIVVGKTNLPPSRKVSLAGVASGAFVGQRVTTDGIVERVEPLGDHLWMQITAGDERCYLSLAAFDGYEKLPLLDSRVRVTGVAGASFKQDQLTGFQLFVSDLRDIEIIETPSADPFSTAPIVAGDLARFAGRRTDGHRVHLRGVVTLHWTNRETIFQDATGAVSIEKGARGRIEPGAEIDVAGFLLNRPGPPQIRNAEVRVLGAGRDVAPAVVSHANDAANGELVRLMARVVSWHPPADGFVSATLDNAGELLIARLPIHGVPKIAEAFAPGATVNAIGVLKSFNRVGEPPLALWMRGPSDLVLLQAPPASTRNRMVAGATATAVMAFAAAALLAALLWRQRNKWVIAAQAQRTAEQGLEEAQRHLRHSRRDRERITQELHDNIIQSIFSVGLSLDEARRMADAAPEKTSQRLGVAVESLNAVIRDVRSFISSGEPKSLGGGELKAALKSVLLSSGVDEQGRFSIEVDSSAARELTSLQATELFNIAREAMYNSIRHARAHSTTVSLTSKGPFVQLEVSDDGVGFSPSEVSASSMGLVNMESRAKRIGATLEVISKAGAGTRAIVKIPLASHASH